jgi:hypothetical protein
LNAAVSLERSNRDRADECEHVGGRKQWRVVPEEEAGEEEQRRDHQPSALVQRCLADTEEERECQHEQQNP